MAHELICAWLGLPPDAWPPSHYRLLGLDPASVDPERVEAEVHRRVEIVRRYQLTHPEPATEAMNRLAQAFVCLTDPESRKAYDARLSGTEPQEPSPPPEPIPEEPADPLAWLLNPEKPDLVAPPPAAARRTRSNGDTAVSAPRPPAQVDIPVATIAEEPSAVREAAREKPVSKRAPVERPAPPPAEPEPTRPIPGGRRGLYWRLARTRQLLEAWEAVGPFLERPTWRASRPAEATELIAQLGLIRPRLSPFGGHFGAAGQPGFLVAALSRQAAIVPTLQTLLPGQREALSRDWKTGQEFLTAGLRSLRTEQQRTRRRRPARRLLRKVREFVVARPGLLLLVLSLLALVIALLRDMSSAN